MTLAAKYPTCLVTRLEHSSLVPAGFLKAQFLQKTGKLGGASLYCLPGGKGKYWKARRMTNGLGFTFLVIH